MMAGFCRVVGDSMEPTIRAGTYVWFADLRVFGLPVGKIYVFRHSELGMMVKRLQGKNGERYIFAGDNPLSIRPEEIGLVDKRDIKGQVIFSFAEGGGIQFHCCSANHVLAK